MSIDDFKGLMDAFDPASLLPELDTVIGKLAFAARLAVLVGPIVMLLLGLLYIFAAPREANYYIGYRCYYGMGSVEAWRFTQKIAGIVFAALGLVTGIAALLVGNGFAGMEIMDLLWRAVYCAAGEAGLTAVACLSINTAAAQRFDSKGNERRKKSKRR